MRATHTDIDSYVDDNGKRLIRKSLSLNVTLRKEYISRIPRWRRPVVGYIFSFLLVGAALLGTLFIEQMLQEHFHFLGSLFSVAVLFVALFWGTGPALLTLLLSTLALDYFFIPPAHQFTFYTLDSALQLLPFIATGLIIALITAQRERARLQTLAAEQELAAYAEDLEATNVQLKEANQMKDRFLSIASHELKTPITTIRGQAQLAMRRIAEIEFPVTAATRDEVGPGRDGLRFEGFKRRVRKAFRGNHRRDVGQVFDDLEAERRIPRNEIVVVERMNEGALNSWKDALLHRFPAGVERRFHEPRSERTHPLDLRLRRGVDRDDRARRNVRPRPD